MLRQLGSHCFADQGKYIARFGRQIVEPHLQCDWITFGAGPMFNQRLQPTCQMLPPSFQNDAKNKAIDL